MFKDIPLQQFYNTADTDIPRQVIAPLLRQAVKYDRTSAYFSAAALAFYADGLEDFDQNNGKYRLLISSEISEEDFNEIKKGYDVRKGLYEELAATLNVPLGLHDEQRLSNLAYLIAKGTVDIRIGFKSKGIFHDKSGIVTDAYGNVVCFRGSYNETVAAAELNYETLDLTVSWPETNTFYVNGIRAAQQEFERLWNNQNQSVVVLPADKVILKEILRFNKGKLIVEEVLLKPDAVVLDYDGQLLLQVNTEDISWLTEKMFFKSRLKHKVERIEGNLIFFSRELCYPDYINIDDLLKKKIPALGHEYLATKRLLDYIEARNLYIDKRSKLGIELKTDAANLEEKYLKFKAVVDAHMTRKLRDKQMQDAFFMFGMTKSCNFSVPGSGKTSSALAMYAFLKANDLVDRVVMIGPKNAFGSWIDEFKTCFKGKEELKYFNLQDTKYKSSAEKSYALKYDTADCNLFLFNYEGIGGILPEIEHIVSSRTLLVFDEVHKVKAIGGQRAGYALEISKYASYMIAMTGTPLPNSYVDLYNLLHILYADEYKDFFGFDISYLKDPLPTDMEIINDRIQPFFCRTTKKELQVPDASPDSIQTVACTGDEQQLFDIIRKKYAKNQLVLFIRLLQMESDPRMLEKSLDLSEFKDVLDITDDISAIDIVDMSADFHELVGKIGTTSKMKRCVELVSKLVDEKKTVIVWCIFKDSILNLVQVLNDIGIKAKCIFGEVELEDRLQLIDDFRNGKYEVLITNPHTLAESVSLHTVCHDAVYFEYSYNLVHLLQSKDRIHRLGLPDGQYTQYYYLQDAFMVDGEEYSLDNKIYTRLLKKEEVMLHAIENNELEPVYTTEEDLAVIFKGLL